MNAKSEINKLDQPPLLSHVLPALAVDEILNVRSGEIVVQLSRLKLKKIQFWGRCQFVKH